MAIGMTLGMEFVHSLGVVHCDVKPSNILLVHKPNGKVVPKIADFGAGKGELQCSYEQRLQNPTVF